jgi:hypothetical protein
MKSTIDMASEAGFKEHKGMNTIKRIWQRLRFGIVTEKVMSIDGGVASEVAYIGRGGKIVGYWAYGSFDPSFPFKG